MLVLVAGAALAVLFRRFLAPTLTLTAGAAALAFLLCPICRRLEKHMRPGLAAAGCLLGALLSLAALLWLLAPALLSQLGDLAGALPAALDTLRGLGQRLGAWARELGLDAAAAAARPARPGRRRAALRRRHGHRLPAAW